MSATLAPFSRRYSSSRRPSSTMPRLMTGGRVDAILVAEAPVLQHPLVERVDDGRRQLGVLGRGVLDEVGQRRVVDAGIDTLTVEFGDAVLGVARTRRGVDAAAGHLPHGQSLGVLAGVELLVRAGRGHPVERRVGHVVGDLVQDRDARMPADLNELHRLLVLLRQVLEQRVRCLVHVLIGIEDRCVGELPFHRVQHREEGVK